MPRMASVSGIESALLATKDLPKGFSLEDSDCLDAATVAEAGHGLKDSCGALYKKVEGDAQVYLTAEVMLFETDFDAESFVAPFNMTYIMAVYNPTFEGFHVTGAEPMVVEPVGDQADGWRMSLLEDSVTYNVGALFMVFRKGPAVGKIAVEAKTAALPEPKLLSQLAEKMAGRIE